MFAKLKRLNSLHQKIRHISSLTDRSYFALWGEIILVVFGANRLQVDDYFTLCLYDRELYPNAKLSTFIGGKAKKNLFHSQFNAIYWDAVQTDKFIQSCVHHQTGTPHPQVQAVFCRYHRAVGDIPLLSTDYDCEQFFREMAEYPLFMKPIKGGSARGTFRAESYDKDSDELVFTSGERVRVSGITKTFDDKTGYGFLIQKAVCGALQTRQVSGKVPTGYRVISLLGDHGVEIFHAVWKVPTGNNYMDNFQKGESGNLLINIDPSSGEILRIIKGAEHGLAMTNEVPGGSYQVGDIAPGWQEVRALVEKATPVFTGFRCQHWDIGLTDQGPVVFEVNANGGWEGTQIVQGHGLLTDEFKAILQRYGDQGKRDEFSTKTSLPQEPGSNFVSDAHTSNEEFESNPKAA